MALIPANTLAKLRSSPQASRLYCIIQQPEYWDGSNWQANWDYAADAWTAHTWDGVVEAAPANPAYRIQVTSSTAVTLYDGMTVFADPSVKGGWRRGIFRVHGDQTIGAGAGEFLYIHPTSEASEIIIGDKVVVLNEFRFWSRYPKVTEAGGVLTWYKDYGYFRDSIAPPAYGLLWTQLGANAGARRNAAMPPTPIMGPHRVAFVDPAVGSVDIDYDWSDSYTNLAGAAVDAWVSRGQDGGAGWNDNVENPAAKTYTNVSGLAGFRTMLEVETDSDDPIVEYRRGVRYVFTMRRPGQTQAGDPPNAEPITEFEVLGIRGDWDSGRWSASIRIYEDKCDEKTVLPGALVILFADDWYNGTRENLGPISGCENIVLIGQVADGTVNWNKEACSVSFDVISLAEQASNRENYPVPIENDDAAVEWYGIPNLTTSRAAWWFLAWHTTLPLITDIYNNLNDAAIEIAGQDFLAGDILQSAVNTFLGDRRFGKLAFDRFGRASMEMDQEMRAAGGAVTSFVLQDGDWIGEAQYREIEERPANLVEAGGVIYAAGVATPKLSVAPGHFAGYEGRPSQKNNLAIASQAELNQLSGDYYAALNNKRAELRLAMCGNWRFGDVWPQEYIVVSSATCRHDFSSDKFLMRAFEYVFDAEAGALFASITSAYETDGPDGITVDILTEMPDDTIPMDTPPEKPPDWGGMCLIGTNDGVYLTENLRSPVPTWVDYGLTGLFVYDLVQDPMLPARWYAACDTGLYYNSDLLGGGTWTQLLSIADINTIIQVASPGADAQDVRGIGFCAYLPGYMAFYGEDTSGIDLWVAHTYNAPSSNTADYDGRGVGTYLPGGYGAMGVSWHTDGGGTEPRCVVLGVVDNGIIFLVDDGDTSGAWTAYANGSAYCHAITRFQEWAYDDDSGIYVYTNEDADAYIEDLTAVLSLLGATIDVGDVGMWHPDKSITRGRLFWTNIDNSYLYCVDVSHFWYWDGISWTQWVGDLSLDSIAPIGAHGDQERGVVVVGVDGDTGSIAVVYSYADGTWDDKIGNLGAISVATIGYVVYLLDD